MDYQITIVCMVCKKIIGTKDGGRKMGEVTHSYCDDCFEVVMEDVDAHPQLPPKMKKTEV